MCVYGHPTLRSWFDAEYEKSGKKLDMGKGCLRFKTLDELALDVVARTVARVTPGERAASYQATRDALRTAAAKRAAAKRPAVPAGAAKRGKRGRPI